MQFPPSSVSPIHSMDMFGVVCRDVVASTAADVSVAVPIVVGFGVVVDFIEVIVVAAVGGGVVVFGVWVVVVGGGDVVVVIAIGGGIVVVVGGDDVVVVVGVVVVGGVVVVVGGGVVVEMALVVSVLVPTEDSAPKAGAIAVSITKFLILAPDKERCHLLEKNTFMFGNSCGSLFETLYISALPWLNAKTNSPPTSSLCSKTN